MPRHGSPRHLQFTLSGHPPGPRFGGATRSKGQPARTRGRGIGTLSLVSVGGRIKWLLRRTLRKAWQDRVLGLSAEAAFWQLLSLPSLALAGVATVGYVSRWFGPNAVNRTETQLESTFSRAFSPDVVTEIVRPTLREVLHGQRIDVISIGFVLALWAGSSATATFVNTITIAYGMRDERGAVRSRLLALWLFLGSVLLGVVVLPLLVLGPTLLPNLFPKSVRPTATSVIHASYYPVVVILLLLGLISLYHLAPPRRLPWLRGAPGALLALGVFLAGSVGLRSYINFILAHNHAYGTLAAPIAALLFFYILALGVLLGAEFNAAIEQMWPTPARPPRLLNRRAWQNLADVDAQSDESPPPPGIDS
jgi:membrane protein